MIKQIQTMLIRGARLIDPATNKDEITDIEIQDGKISAIGQGLFASSVVIPADGCVVCPGFIDLAHHLREPGLEHKGTIATEMACAAANGFTRVVCMPGVRPVNDNPAVTRLILEKAKSAGFVELLPLGALTQALAGEQLSEMYALKKVGCVGMTNDNQPIGNHLILLRCFEYAKTHGLLVVSRPEDAWLGVEGCAHDGPITARMGLAPLPRCSETIAVARDILLMKQTRARLHFSRITCEESLELIAQAQSQGWPVTCDVSITHLFYSDEAIEGFNALFYLRPPLRSTQDREALRRGLAMGVVQAVCSDHQPHEPAAKLAPFAISEPGVSSLDGFLSQALKLVSSKVLSMNQLIAALTVEPARCLGVEAPALTVGKRANLTLLNPALRWTLSKENCLSMGLNNPLLGTGPQSAEAECVGKTLLTLRGAKMTYVSDELKPFLQETDN